MPVERHARHLLTGLLFVGSVGCTGGVPCPEATYTPVGPLLETCADAEACPDDDSCVLFCATGCAEAASGRCVCEPCARVEAWADANCPDPACLERSTPGELGWDLALTCTTE